MNSLSTKFN